MELLPLTATDDQLLAFADRWAALMEQENYEAAFALTGHIPEMTWSPSLMREVIKAYGECDPAQRVTVHGKPTDITQRKSVGRWPRSASGEIAEIWYDLNLDGFVSDLTATFAVVETDAGLEVRLNDIHVRRCSWIGILASWLIALVARLPTGANLLRLLKPILQPA